MKLIYVAGPYTARTWSGVEDNIREAARVSVELFRRGWSVFTSHMNTAHYEMLYDGTTITPETFYEAGFVVLDRCDAIFMMRGWRRSKGSVKELARAKKHGLGVFYETDGFPMGKR